MPQFDFFCSFYKDEIFLVRLAYQVSKYFPESKLIAIADGSYHALSLNVAKEFNQNLILVEGDRLKNKPHGGCEFTQRNLQAVLSNSSAEVIVKIDPDSYITRSFECPDADWFGHVHYAAIPFLSENFDFIAGGAMGFSRETVKAIVQSGELLNKKYDNQDGFYNRYQNYRKFADPSNETDPIRREDWVIGSVCKKLKIEATHWDDVYCVQDEEQDTEQDFSILHPVRTRY